MKKTLPIVSIMLLLNSCITSSHIGEAKGLENLPRNSYTVLEERTSISRTNKFWILFIPFGGKSEEKREAQCLTRMLTENNANGVIAPNYVSKKITIPLILFTYSYKWTTLKAKPYIVKTDIDQENTKYDNK